MTEKLVELGSYFHDALRSLFLYNHVANFVTVGLPVWLRDRYWTVEAATERKRSDARGNMITNGIRLHFESLEY